MSPAPARPEDRTADSDLSDRLVTLFVLINGEDTQIHYVNRAVMILDLVFLWSENDKVYSAVEDFDASQHV